MMRATFGFDYADFGGSQLDTMYDILNGTWTNFSAGTAAGKPALPGQGLDGRSGFKWLGNGMFTRVFSQQTFWVVGFDFMRAGMGGAGQDQFVQISYAGGVLVALRTNSDGTLSILVGGDGSSGSGTEVVRSTYQAPVGDWNGYTELKAYGFGGTTTVELWMDDVLIASGTCAPGAGLIPDRIAIGSQGDGGKRIDNVYYLDGQGTSCNDRLGPIRISTIGPIRDRQKQFTPNMGTTNWPIVGATATNSTNFVEGVFGDQDLYGIDKLPCYGQILCVSLNVIAELITGAPFVQLFCKGNPANSPVVTQIGDGFVSPDGYPLQSVYHTFQALTEVNLRTGAGVWTDGAMQSAYWGMAASTADTGIVRVTQLFLEKVVSLRNTPFDCQNAASRNRILGHL